MVNITENIIKTITADTTLSSEEVHQMIETKKQELHYFSKDNVIPRLIAQELNVHLGNYPDYLHAILEFIAEPVRVYFYVFPSTSKEQLMETFQRFSLSQIIEEGTTFSSGGWTLEPDEQFSLVFGKNGFVILFCLKKVEEFPDEEETATYSIGEQLTLGMQIQDYIRGTIREGLRNLSFDEIVNRSTLKKTISGSQVVKDLRSNKAYIPIDIIKREVLSHFNPSILAQKPWLAPEFPYVSLEPLQEDSNCEDIELPRVGIHDIVGLENLRSSEKIKSIVITDTLIHSFNLQVLGRLPNLEALILYQNRLERIDLTPLKQCPKLKILDLGCNSLKAIDLAPLGHCSELEVLSLVDNKLSTIDLAPLKQCPNLREVRLYENQIESFNLTPLLYCPSLREVGLRDLHTDEKKRVIPPLVDGPKALTVIGALETDIIDLTGREVHQELDVGREKESRIDQLEPEPPEARPQIIEKPEGYTDSHLTRVKELLKDKKYKELRKELDSNPDFTLYSIRRVLYEHNPYIIGFSKTTPELGINALGFLGLQYGNLRVLDLLREIIIFGDEVHPEIWQFAVTKFQMYVDDINFSKMHRWLFRDYTIGFRKYSSLMKLMAIEIKEYSDFLVPLITHPDSECRAISYKLLLRPVEDPDTLFMLAYFGIRDPDEIVRRTMVEELVKRIRDEAMVVELLEEVKIPQERLDTMMKSIKEPNRNK